MNPEMSKTPAKSGHMSLAQVEGETPIDMAEVRSLFGERPSKQTLYNWRKRGVRVDGKSVYLGWYKDCGRIMSTREAVERFQRDYDGE